MGKQADVDRAQMNVDVATKMVERITNILTRYQADSEAFGITPDPVRIADIEYRIAQMVETKAHLQTALETAIYNNQESTT